MGVYTGIFETYTKYSEVADEKKKDLRGNCLFKLFIWKKSLGNPVLVYRSWNEKIKNKFAVLNLDCNKLVSKHLYLMIKN